MIATCEDCGHGDYDHFFYHESCIAPGCTCMRFVERVAE